MPKKTTPHPTLSGLEQHRIDPNRFVQRPQLTADAALQAFKSDPTTMALCDLLWCLDVWQMEITDSLQSDEETEHNHVSLPNESWDPELVGPTHVSLPRWALLGILEKLSDLALRELDDGLGPGRKGRRGTRLGTNRIHLVRYLMARELIESGGKTREQAFNEVADQLTEREHFAAAAADAIGKSYDKVRKKLLSMASELYIPGSPVLRRRMLEKIGTPDAQSNRWLMPDTESGEETP